MPAAMALVREELGDDAIILSSKTERGKKGITVIAALDENNDFETGIKSPQLHKDVQRPEPSKPSSINSETAEKIRAQLGDVLRFHNVPESLLPKIFAKADPRELASIEALHQLGAKQDANSFVRLALEKTLAHFFTFRPITPEGNDKRIMLVGPPGVGKTLTIARLAARVHLAEKPLAIFTSDTKRAGGIEQLQAFTDILEVELQVAQSPKALARMLSNVTLGTHVLVDTAGANPYDSDEMKEVAALANIESIEPILTMACGGDSLEAIDTAEAFAKLPIKRMLITRTDTARRLGGVIAAAASTKLALSNMSTSASAIEPLPDVTSQLLTKLLLRYQLQFNPT